MGLFLGEFVLNGVLRWPLLEVLAILAPLSLLWAWPKGEGNRGGFGMKARA